MILYTSLLSRGICLTPFLIIIPNWAKGDAGYLAHEQTHAAQQQRDGVITFWWRYLTNKSWRLAYEVDAFHAQYKTDPGNLYKCGEWLATGYNLDLDIRDAMNMIMVGHMPENYTSRINFNSTKRYLLGTTG